MVARFRNMDGILYLQNTLFRPEKHETFCLRQRLYLCEEIRWPAESNYDYELVKTTAHSGRPEEPLS